MTVSLIGDGIFIVALAWQVYELSNAPTALSLVGLAMTIPNVVFLLIGGVVSDRFDRRRVLVAADLIRGLAVAAMGVLSLNGTIELWHLMVLAAVYGGGTAFFGPAFDAIVPDLVASDLLIQANSLDQFVRPAAWRLAGPAIGGFLVAWSTGGAFLVDAVTFGDLDRGAAADESAPHRRADAMRDPSRRSPTSEKASVSCAPACGCGERSSPRRSPTCCSSARRRCCCRCS